MLIIRGLDSIKGRDVCLFSISAKENRNIDKVLEWLIKYVKKET
jgi:hypothetical protein